MKKLFSRLAASFLTIIFLFSQNPILAQELAESVASGTQDVNTVAEPQILDEVTGKRDRFVKHFRMSDGSMKAIVYSNQVHYKDGNEFKEIDNTLIEGEEEYTNTESPLNVKVSKSFNDNKLVSINSDGHEISWSYIKKNRKIKVKKMVAKSEVDSQAVEQSASETDENTAIEENSESDNSAETTTSASPEAFEEIEVTEALDIQPDAVSIENFKTKNKNFANKKEEKIDASKASSKAKFKNADPELDFDYTISGLNFKENIILNKKLEFNNGDSFDFEFKTNGLKLEKDTAGNLNFIDENGKIVFSMPKGSMWDAGEGFSSDINYEFKESENGYIISVVPNYEWINSMDRVFPISIDPSITLPYLGDNSYEYAVTDPYNPNTPDSSHGHIPVGTSDTNYQSFLRYTGLPSFSHGEMVTDAAFEIALPSSFPDGSPVYFGTLPMQACVRPVTSAWQASTLTYANKPPVSSTVCDYITADAVGKWYNCDITKLTKDWYSLDNPNSNFGFELDTFDPSQYGLMRFISKNTSSYPGDGPRLTISYRNFIGEEPYWSYTGHSAGLNGNGKVNNYAGTLSVSENILSYSGSRNPVSISNSYNVPNYNDNANTLLHLQTFAGGYSHSSSMGLGWSPDFNQLIYPLPESDSLYKNEGGNYRYLYIDDDGTWHYFYRTDATETTFIDEDGLQFTIAKDLNSANTLYLTDLGGNKLTFEKVFSGDTCFALKYSKDSDGNQTEYFYEYQPGTPGSKVSRIRDNAGRETHIAYDRTQNMITEITEADGKKTTFTYDGQKLTEIDYPDGLKTVYVYDTQGRLSKVWTNEGTSSSVVYQYMSNDPRSLNFFKVKSVTEFGSQNEDPSSEGNSVNFDYSMNQTDITSKINNLDVPYHEAKETWQFDHDGRTTAIIDENGNMVAKYYENATNGKKNKVKHANDTGKYTNNLLKNTAVANGLTNWTVSNGDQSYPQRGDTTWDVTADTTQSYLGAQSFKIKQSCSSFPILEQKVNIQKLSLPKKYTLSGYVKVIGNLADGGDGASLRLSAYDGTTHLDGDTYSESIYSTDATASTEREKGWRKISVTFTVPAGADTISCCASMRHSNGEAYFDCFQLEEGEFANDYNAVENSSFDSGLDKWSNDSELGGEIISGRLKLVGAPTLNKSVYQIIPINRVNPVLAIRATAQGTAMPNNVVKYTGFTTKYCVRVLLNFDDDTNQPVDLYFNPNVSDTQSLYASICVSDYSGGKTLTSITVGPGLYANCNNAYFDNIQVCIDDNGVQYKRNDKGSVEEIIDNTGNKTTITHDPNSDEITKITKLNGNEINLSYNNSTSKPHQLADSTIQTPGGNIKPKFSYDSYGNVTSSQIQDALAQGQLMTSSTDYGSNKGYNYPESTTDSRGEITKFDYNQNNGNLNSVIDPKGVTTNFTYDTVGRLLTATCGGSQNVWSYTNGILSSLSHKIEDGVNVVYNFAYDIFGNITSTKVGNQTLSANTYDAGNGLLRQVKYSNNQQVQFDYDKFGRLIKKRYHNDKNKQNGGFEYIYDNKNRLVQTFDEENNLTTNFEYDIYGRIAYLRRSDGTSSDVKYNLIESGLIDKVTSKLFGITQIIENTFGLGNMLTNSKITIGSTSVWSKYNYDALGRIQSTEALNSDETTGIKHEISYLDYVKNVDGTDIQKTTNFVNSVEFKKKVSGNWVELNKKFNYEYDNVGNITNIKDKNSNLIVHYEYDDLNQLTRENNTNLNKTIKYYYDLGGNIQKKEIYAYTTADTLNPNSAENTIKYGYADSNWKDKMTSYNNQSIIYDGMGNPVVYRNGLNFEWARGRKLDKASNQSYNVTYKYDDGGVRTSKTINGTTTEFITSGIKVLAQKTGNNVLNWHVDGNGETVGFNYNNGTQSTQYFYLKNAQGDIAGITDASGNIIAEYVYDSWGKMLHVFDATGTEITDSSNIALINPLRYRGYYYDSELGLYYLNSRYYDPETGRFLNADDNFEDGTNLFEYCSNDPVSFVDPDGSTKEDASEYIKKNPRPIYDIHALVWSQQYQAKLDAWNKGLTEALNKTAPAPAAQPEPTATNVPSPAKTYPVPGGTTGCKFNCKCKTHNGKHNGIDIKSGGKSKKIVASAEGTVKDVRYSNSYGNLITIAYGDYLALYAHMKDKSSLKVGDKVNAGDEIGYTGNTGASQGIHLHFGIAKNVPKNTYTNLVSNKYWVNPEEWLKS